MARIRGRAVGANRRAGIVGVIERVVTLGAQRAKLAYRLWRASKNYRSRARRRRLIANGSAKLKFGSAQVDKITQSANAVGMTLMAISANA
jgi:hypothetical protein